MAGFPEAQTLKKLNQAVISSPEVLNDADLKIRIVATDSYVIDTALAPASSSTPNCACCPAAASMPNVTCQTSSPACFAETIPPTPKECWWTWTGSLNQRCGLEGLLIRNLPFAASISASPMFEVNIQPTQ